MCQREKLFLNGLLIVMFIFISVGWVEQIQSQDKYPTRAIDIICPWAPGGSTDLTARVMADYLKKKWGVPVNVVNKPGGGTIPACLEVYQAKPDGYTILAENGSSAPSLPIVFKELPFEVMNRTFLGMHTELPFVFAVPKDSPFKTFKDLINDIKKNPDEFTWASLGGAAFHDIAMKQLCKAIGIDILKTKPIMAAGGSKAVVLTAGGHVKVGGGTPSSCLPAFKAGTIRALAVTSKERWADFLDIPTTAEMGLPTVDIHQWHGASGPPNMPSHIVATWEKVIAEMVKDHDVISRMKNIGTGMRYLDSKGLKEHVIKETELLKDLWGVKK